MSRKLKLGVNIDHVATLRQARYALMPEAANLEPRLREAAVEAEAAGADSITVHLRADRRHIQERDVWELRDHSPLPLNLEMGNTPEILRIALDVRPDYVCLVPENRAEITTEGGLDLVKVGDSLADTVRALQENGTQVSLFIDPEPAQVEAAVALGAEMVELHTGAFANASVFGGEMELKDLAAASWLAHQDSLQVNAGHGINMNNLPTLLQVPHLAELNVGHHLISRAVFVGLRQAVSEMLAVMEDYQGD